MSLAMNTRQAAALRDRWAQRRRKNLPGRCARGLPLLRKRAISQLLKVMRPAPQRNADALLAVRGDVQQGRCGEEFTRILEQLRAACLRPAHPPDLHDGGTPTGVDDGQRLRAVAAG